jgi:hypothetical protein
MKKRIITVKNNNKLWKANKVINDL